MEASADASKPQKKGFGKFLTIHTKHKERHGAKEKLHEQADKLVHAQVQVQSEQTETVSLRLTTTAPGASANTDTALVAASPKAASTTEEPPTVRVIFKVDPKTAYVQVQADVTGHKPPGPFKRLLGSLFKSKSHQQQEAQATPLHHDSPKKSSPRKATPFWRFSGRSRPAAEQPSTAATEPAAAVTGPADSGGEQPLAAMTETETAIVQPPAHVNKPATTIEQDPASASEAAAAVEQAPADDVPEPAAAVEQAPAAALELSSAAPEQAPVVVPNL